MNDLNNPDVLALRPWLEYPTWSLREGLLLLAGIDPHRSKDIHSNEDCTAFEASPPPGTLVGGPAWGRIGYPQRAEVGADGVPRLVNGPVFSLDDHVMLWKLMEHWHRTPAHDGMTRATPAHFIGWAEFAGMAPHWLGAVRCAGYLPSAPAVAAPEPVATPAEAVPQGVRAMKTPEANQINALDTLKEAKKPDGSPMFDLLAIPRLEGRKSPAKQYLMQHLRLSSDAAKLALSALESDGKIKYANPVKTTR